MTSFIARVVDTLPILEECLDHITSSEATKLAVDLEGVNLCRLGRLSIIQILRNQSDIIWLVDVTSLGALSFEHANASGQSLKTVLENKETVKVLYDVRNDSDALFNLFGITLANVCDLQLLEVAVRRSNMHNVRHLSGLAKSLDQYVHPPSEWQQVKEAGSALLFPNKGGSYEVFERRPLDPRVISYAAQDVSLLFQLEAVLEGRIGRFGRNWRNRVLAASLSRVNEAKQSYYEVDGRSRAVAAVF